MRVLIHASPSPIVKITAEHPLLGNLCFLDFSADAEKVEEIDALAALAGAYALGEINFVYAVEVDDGLICRRRELHDSGVIADIAARFDIDEEGAESVLDGSASIFEILEDRDEMPDCEDLWWLQAQEGIAAQKMGYWGVDSDDEQGPIVIAPMIGQAARLVLVAQK